jgi:hypothetical protein
MATETIHLEGLPAVEKLLAQYQGQPLQNKMRQAVRAGMKPFQQQLKFEGDTPGHPHSFTNVPAAKITTHGGESGRAVEGSVKPRSPLFNIFEPGAHPHVITPGSKGVASERTTSMFARSGARMHAHKAMTGHAGGKVLAGQAGGSIWPARHGDPGRKRSADFFTTKAVQHPGMSARPILPTAFEAAAPAAEDRIAEAIFAMVAPAESAA